MLNRFERFSQAIAEISRHWHKIAADEMEKHGLKGPHATYLIILYRHPEGITAPRICELCGKDKSDVSRMMSIMEQQGLVQKEGGHQNRYGGYFRLTEEGQRAAGHVCRRASLAVELAGKDLTDRQREVFYQVLETVTANLRELSKKGLPPALTAPVFEK